MAKQALIILFTVLAFGILVPWYKGFTFLDPRMLAAYGFLAVLFVAPASAESFAGDRDLASTRALLGRLIALIGLDGELQCWCCSQPWPHSTCPTGMDRSSRHRPSFSRECSCAVWRLRRRWEP